MSQRAAIQSLNPVVPVLFMAPANEYPGLQKVKQQMFDALPKICKPNCMSRTQAI